MSTASNEPLAKPGEGFSSLFFTTRSDASPVGLATESFLAIMSHLGELDLVRASHVCANWRKAIVNCSTLWTKLDQVNVASMNSLDRVRAFASRSKVRNLASLFIWLWLTAIGAKPGKALLAHSRLRTRRPRPGITTDRAPPASGQLQNSFLHESEIDSSTT